MARDVYVTRSLSMAAVAAEAGVSISTVHRRLRSYGIATRAEGIRSTRRDPTTRVAEVLTAEYLTEAHRKGMSAAGIGRDTGVDVSTVARYLRAHGLPVAASGAPIAVDARRLARLAAEGVPTVEIATEFGCSTATIDRRLRRYGIRDKPAPRRRYEMPVERLAEMSAEGWTLVEMAAVFGCHFSTVSYRLRRDGLR